MVALKNSLKKISYIYLLAVPVLVTALAFIVGHVNYRIYIPLWLLNAGLMMMATQRLSKAQGGLSAKTASFFIFPWMLFPIFAGMGPPPETAKEWANQANEQLFRYTLLIVGGVSMGMGFFRSNRVLAKTSGHRYAKWAAILMSFALPLFIVNMAYWGYFLTNIFITYSIAGAPAKPGWLKSLDELFTIIRMVEVSFVYLSTAALSKALRLSNHLSQLGSFIYIIFACMGAVLNILPSGGTGPLAIANYLSYIPAFTMLMPYLMAVNAIGSSVKELES